jgi:arsenate reductase
MSTKPIFYGYSGCGTCRKALAWLKGHNVTVDQRPIREQPPTESDLKKALVQLGALRPLFNTSGGDYKELRLKDKLPHMKESDALKLLASRGNLIKRPFVVYGKRYLVGFNEDAYEETFG